VHRLLVAPVLEREELALVGDALEALELDEAIGLRQVLAQRIDDAHVVREAAFVGSELENHGDHGRLPS
jgi:hypothetical protein